MKKKVLIIEDDRFTREMYQRQFEKSGYQVITAQDGLQGLQAISTAKPDFILLDIMLPKLDGATLLSKVRQEEKRTDQPSIPIILLTNLGQEVVLNRCQQLGVSGLIIKSRFTPQEVVKEVKALLSHH